MEENSRLKKIIDMYVDQGANNEYLHDEIIKTLNNASNEEKTKGYQYLNWRLSEIKRGDKENLNKRQREGYIIGIVIVILIIAFAVTKINTNNKVDRSYDYSISYIDSSYKHKTWDEMNGKERKQTEKDIRNLVEQYPWLWEK